MGHLFITRADLTSFECDDWLIPTGRRAQVENQWWDGREKELKEAGAKRPGELLNQELFHNDGQRFLTVDSPGKPRAWLGWTASRSADLEWFVSGALEFIDHVIEHAPNKFRNKRYKRLIALPAIGAGKGGGYEKTGQIFEKMIPALLHKAENCEADIALVTYSEEEFSAAQAVRLKLSINNDFWIELDEKIKEQADQIAGYAVEGKLIIFFGAGISAGSGLPPWKDLIDEMMKKAGLGKDEIESVSKWSALDQAQFIERVLSESGKQSIGEVVVELIKTQENSNLSHSFLAIAINE